MDISISNGKFIKLQIKLKRIIISLCVQVRLVFFHLFYQLYQLVLVISIIIKQKSFLKILYIQNQENHTKMKKISVENFVKTSCGIDQYNSLKKNKSIFGKLRLSWFLFFATIRDLFVSKKN